jgi:hypothetical protein
MNDLKVGSLEAPLTALNIGMWSSTGHEDDLMIYILPNKRSLVLISDRSRPASRGSAQRFTATALKQLGACSPFSSSYYGTKGCVISFEVDFDRIIGLDYLNPLLQTGRLVMEAEHIRKREFRHVLEATSYYGLYNSSSYSSLQAIDSLHTPPSPSLKPQNNTNMTTPTPLPVISNNKEQRPKNAKSNLMKKLGQVASKAKSSISPQGSNSSNNFISIIDDKDVDGLVISTTKQNSPAAQQQEVITTTDVHCNASSSENNNNNINDINASLHPPPPILPAFHWTTTAAVYKYRTIIIHFNSPQVPDILRPIISQDERLLKLYESGIPAWAIFLPSYGLWYRPWLRYLTWILFYAFSIVSLLAGFFELYKSVPGFQTLMRSLAASLWLPPSSLLEWLEAHTQIRLSLLLTYMFGKSDFFVAMMRRVAPALHVVRAATRPLVEALSPAIGALTTLVQSSLQPIIVLLTQCWSALAAAAAPLMASFGDFSVWGDDIRKTFGGFFSVAWTGLVDAGRGLTAGAATVKHAAATGSSLATSTTQAYQLPSFAYLFDAWYALKDSVFRLSRAASAVFKFWMQMAYNTWRHRFTLTIRARRMWRRFRGTIYNWTWTVPTELLMQVIKWLIITVKVTVIDKIEAGYQIVKQEDALASGYSNGGSIKEEEEEKEVEEEEPKKEEPKKER